MTEETLMEGVRETLARTPEQQRSITEQSIRELKQAFAERDAARNAAKKPSTSRKRVSTSSKPDVRVYNGRQVTPEAGARLNALDARKARFTQLQEKLINSNLSEAEMRELVGLKDEFHPRVHLPDFLENPERYPIERAEGRRVDNSWFDEPKKEVTIKRKVKIKEKHPYDPALDPDLKRTAESTWGEVKNGVKNAARDAEAFGRKVVSKGGKVLGEAKRAVEPIVKAAKKGGAKAIIPAVIAAGTIGVGGKMLYDSQKPKTQPKPKTQAKPKAETKDRNGITRDGYDGAYDRYMRDLQNIKNRK